MTALLDIVDAGAVTAIGRDARHSVAAARAGFCGFREHPFMIDMAGVPMRVAAATGWRTGRRAARLASLLVPALEQALGAPAAGASAKALFLALPAPRPGLPDDVVTQLESAIDRRFGRALRVERVFATGHAAAVQALEAASRHLAASGTDACIVGAVDSYLEPETLEWLETREQLHGAGHSNNAWGFIPGEAGAALRVGAIDRRLAGPAGGAPLGALHGLGLATEPHGIKSDAVCLGEGLTQAFRRTFESLPADTQVADVYGDFNGEPYRADEYGFAALRTRRHFRSAGDFVAPADGWGDVGAAGVPLHIALACTACRQGWSHGPWSLVTASSEGGERGAALVRAPWCERA